MHSTDHCRLTCLIPNHNRSGCLIFAATLVRVWQVSYSQSGAPQGACRAPRASCLRSLASSRCARCLAGRRCHGSGEVEQRAPRQRSNARANIRSVGRARDEQAFRWADESEKACRRLVGLSALEPLCARGSTVPCVTCMPARASQAEPNRDQPLL